jgi:hypothetical protein
MGEKVKNEKWKVNFSEEVKMKLDDIPDDVYEKFSKLVKGFESGELNPKMVGKPVDWVELEVKLKCPECKSDYVEWLLDKNSNEVDFSCLECDKSFWMTHEEYEKTVRKNPDKIAINTQQ